MSRLILVVPDGGYAVQGHLPIHAVLVLPHAVVPLLPHAVLQGDEHQVPPAVPLPPAVALRPPLHLRQNAPLKRPATAHAAPDGTIDLDMSTFTKPRLFIAPKAGTHLEKSLSIILIDCSLKRPHQS